MLKPKSRHIALLVAALLLVTSSAFAQPPRHGPERAAIENLHESGMMIPDLTDTQKEQIKELRVEHMKALQILRNQMAEKKARLRTLSTSDKVKMTEINRVIEDIGEMRTQMMKLKAQQRQDIRKLLTDEQRVMFDAHEPSHHDGHPQARPHLGKKQH